MRKALVSSALSGVVIVACSGTSAIDIEKYDRSCNNLNDCFVVVTDACCGCPNAAINVDAKAQYMTDLAAAKMNCGGVACPAIACIAVVTGCQAGLCITQAATIDAGTDAAADTGTD
jgi:hypothetical protein